MVMVKKYIYAALILIYIGFSVITITYSSKWMQDVNFLIIASKARDVAILAANDYHISNVEAEELKNLPFNEINDHPANIRLKSMFDSKFGFDDIRFVYVVIELKDDQIKYRVTEEHEKFYGAKAGTPLNIMWLADVVPGKTTEEVLAEDANSYDDIRRYSYLRPFNETIFQDRKPHYEIAADEYGPFISGMAPVYTEEGAFLGMLGIDIYTSHYQSNVVLIKMLMLLVFLLPTIALTAIYMLLYVMNIKHSHDTANTDPLTSVSNRRFLDKYLPRIVRDHHSKQQPLSVIMIDIDHFKAYNDNYGHQQGDKVLVEITQAINSVLREKIDFICRFGGEEFVVILTNTKTADADKIAHRIKMTVNGAAVKHEYSKVSDVVTISQGIYSAIPLHNDTDKTFIEYADKGLYMAKNSGRNRYVFYECAP